MRIPALLLVLLVLAGCAGNFGPGTLVLRNQRSGETATVDYRDQNGRLIPAGVERASYLMRDVRTGEGMMMDVNLLDQLVRIRNALRLRPSTLIEITSGFRSHETNDALRQQSSKVASNSYHLYGKAIDFKIPGVPYMRIYDAALRLKMGGVAYYDNTQHVHIDTGPPRTWKTE